MIEEKVDYKNEVLILLEKYSKSKKPIQVNFKELTKGFKMQDRATHQIHTYPAKLLPNIPYFFLNNTYFSVENEVVLDPFCGSGTVLLEAILANKRALGSDANPLATLISRVKTYEYNCDELIKKSNYLKSTIYKSDIILAGLPKVVNIDFWFLPSVKGQLNTILYYLKKIKDRKTRDFFILCFSNCVKKVSLADQKISVPVKIKGQESNKILFNISEKPNFVFDKFFEIIEENINRFKRKSIIGQSIKESAIVSKDAKKLKKLNNDSVDLIITSPPYAGAQKYIRASSLNIYWTELSKKNSLRDLDKKNIGRENYNKSEFSKLKSTKIEKADILLKEIFKVNPLRAHIAANYLLEMRKAIKEALRVLKKNRYMVLIAANNQVCGLEFETQEFLRVIAEQEGFITECRLIDDIKSYGLMTKRNKTASIITCEWVLILKKI